MIIELYNGIKGLISAIIDGVFGGVPRQPIPAFGTPMAAGDYLIKGTKYTGDKAKGLLDFDTNPEVLQAAISNGFVVGKDEAFKDMHIDCDDYACWAYAAGLKIPGNTGKIYTLLDSGLVGSHVIYIGCFNGQWYGIDTNGYRNLPGGTESIILVTWTNIYRSLGYSYIKAVETPFPFPVKL